MKSKFSVVLLLLVVLVSCKSLGANKEKPITKEYLNGTWYSVPREEYTGNLFEEEYTWGIGLSGNNFFVFFDIERGIFSRGDGLRFLDYIRELEKNVFEVGLNIPIDHPPTPEEIAAYRAAGSDEIIVVHFINKDCFWMELLKGFDVGKDFNPKTNIYYRYSGPGTAVKENN